MRAGLLSDGKVIRQINETFVPTWVIIDDAKKFVLEGDPLAKTVMANWEYPLDFMFFSPDGQLINKLNSFAHLRDAHPEVGHPPDGRGRAASHHKVFLNHIQKHFGGTTPASSSSG